MQKRHQDNEFMKMIVYDDRSSRPDYLSPTYVHLN